MPNTFTCAIFNAFNRRSYPDEYHPLNYTLTGSFQYSIAEYAVKKKIFTFFLPTGCVPLTSDHKTHERIVRMFSSDSGAGTPITVYGYDNSVPVFGGDTYEAETNCVKEHNMGQVNIYRVATERILSLCCLSSFSNVSLRSSQVASYVNNVGFYDRLGPADLPFVPKISPTQTPGGISGGTSDPLPS